MAAVPAEDPSASLSLLAGSSLFFCWAVPRLVERVLTSRTAGETKERGGGAAAAGGAKGGASPTRRSEESRGERLARKLTSQFSASNPVNGLRDAMYAAVDASSMEEIPADATGAWASQAGARRILDDKVAELETIVADRVKGAGVDTVDELRGEFGETILHQLLLLKTSDMFDAAILDALARFFIVQFGRTAKKEARTSKTKKGPFDDASDDDSDDDDDDAGKSVSPGRFSQIYTRRPSGHRLKVRHGSIYSVLPVPAAVQAAKEADEESGSELEKDETVEHELIKHTWMYLLDATYLDFEYYGETALHLAVVLGDAGAVKGLLHAGADVKSPRACGQFFCPFPQTSNCGSAPPDIAARLRDDRLGFVYMGESVLSFAACQNDMALVDLCLAHGADICARDGHGNTVIHALVLYSLRFKFEGDKDPTQMISALMSRGARPCLTMPNKNGETPLNLACGYARDTEEESSEVTDMVRLLLECTRQQVWIFPPVACYRYPLQGVTHTDLTESVAVRVAKGKDNASDAAAWSETHSCQVNQSALAKAVATGSKEAIMPLLTQRILQDQWDAFGSRAFLRDFSDVLALLLLQILAIHLRPSGQSMRHLFEIYASSADIVRTAIEVAIVLLSANKGRKDLQNMWKTGLGPYFMRYNGSQNMLEMFYLASISFAVLARLRVASLLFFPDDDVDSILGDEASEMALLADVEMIALCSAIISLFVLSVYMLRMFRWIGPLVLAIVHIVLHDFAKFAVLVGVFCVMTDQVRSVVFFNGSGSGSGSDSDSDAASSAAAGTGAAAAAAASALGEAAAAAAAAASVVELDSDEAGECAGNAESLWKTLLVVIGADGCDTSAMHARSTMANGFFSLVAEPLFLFVVFVTGNLLVGMFSATYEDQMDMSETNWTFSRAQLVLDVAGEAENLERWTNFMRQDPHYTCQVIEEEEAGEKEEDAGAEEAKGEKARSSSAGKQGQGPEKKTRRKRRMEWSILLTERLDGEAAL